MLATFHRQAWERLRINPVGRCGGPQTDKAVRAGLTASSRLSEITGGRTRSRTLDPMTDMPLALIHQEIFPNRTKVRAFKINGLQEKSNRCAWPVDTDFGVLKACSSNAQGLHSTVFGSHLTEKGELEVLFLSKPKIVGYL